MKDIPLIDVGVIYLLYKSHDHNSSMDIHNVVKKHSDKQYINASDWIIPMNVYNGIVDKVFIYVTS